MSAYHSLRMVAAGCALVLGVGCQAPAQQSPRGEAESAASSLTPARPASDLPAVGGWPADDLAPGFARTIVLVTIDTLRADVLGSYGKQNAATPALDELAATGVRFQNAHAHNVMTLPSHANMLTGRHPFEHGIRDNAGFRLGEQWPTMATLLAAEGYETGAVIGAFPLDARFGLDRGFDYYDDSLGEGSTESSYTMPERRGDAVVRSGLDWLSQRTGKAFLWLHLFDPHAPYRTERRFHTQHPEDSYQAEVSAVDAYLAPLFEEIAERSPASTLLIVTSDHGEALGEHGERTHGLFAYESTLRVPLILWSGALPASGVDAREARHIDLLPTVLDAAGLESEIDLPGHSLLRPAPDESETYFEALGPALNRGWAPLRGVIRDHSKFISLPIPELYDLRRDPAEAVNLVQQERDTVRALRRLIPEASDWPPTGRQSLSEQEVQRLRALGYLSSNATAKSTFGPEDDPKNLVHVDQLAHRFVEAYQSRRLDEAEQLARELVEVRPTMGLGYYHLSQILLDRGKTSEALEVMATAYRRELATPGLRRQLALSLAEAGRPLEALQVLDSLGPSEDPDTLNVRGLVLTESGRIDEAVRTLQSIFAVDAVNPQAHENLARAEIMRRRWAEAATHARAALDVNQSMPLAWNYLGVAEYNLGRAKAALRAWQAALQLAPDDYDLLFNLAIVSAEQGERTMARDALTRFIEQAPRERYAPDIASAQQRLRQLDGQP